MDNKNNLENALKIIFRDSGSAGFWDSRNNYISEKISAGKDWRWHSLHSGSHRYGLFTLSMILLSKDLYSLDTKKYDNKIVDFIYWIYNNLKNLSTPELTYGGLLSVILGKKLFNLDQFELDVIEEALSGAYNNIVPFTDNQNSLILIASKYFLDLKKSEEQLSKLKKLTSFILSSKNDSAFFETGDVRAIYHQRIMYALWSLLFASRYYSRERIKTSVEDTLNFVWEKRRDRKDDAFLWHPSFYMIKYKNKFKIPVFNPKSAKYLFECHQTFFANSINFYQKFFNSNLFQHEKEKAMEWIWGKNRINKNLNEVTGIGIPARIMDLNGNLFIKGQQFIGSYEIGSFILALAADMVRTESA